MPMLDLIFGENVSVGTVLDLYENDRMIFNVNDGCISEVIFKED